MSQFTEISGVKVFSTTMAREREVMGERVTVWIREHPQLSIIDRVITQSSDNEFHCLTISLFYVDKSVAARK